MVNVLQYFICCYVPADKAQAMEFSESFSDNSVPVLLTYGYQEMILSVLVFHSF